MKILVLSLILLFQPKNDSASVWNSVGKYKVANADDSGPLSAAEVGAIRSALREDEQVAQCGDEAADVLQKLSFKRIRLSRDGESVLVQAGRGCLRSGQGANGSMWIIRLRGGVATVLASPADGFEGWVYSVQATTNKGYRDIVLGWHMSANEYGLNYFRFDGTRYRSLSGATARIDEDGRETITPAR